MGKFIVKGKGKVSDSVLDEHSDDLLIDFSSEATSIEEI